MYPLLASGAAVQLAHASAINGRSTVLSHRTLTLAKYTYEIGGRLHSAMRTIGSRLAHECPKSPELAAIYVFTVWSYISPSNFAMMWFRQSLQAWSMIKDGGFRRP